MERGFNALTLAAVAIVIAVIVAAAIMITDGGKARFNKATRQMNSATSEFDNPALQAYEGSEYSGAEVINAINKYAGKDLGIRVRVKTSKRGRQFRAKYNNNWPINETASFSSELIRDKNNNITGMIFQQDGIEEPSSLEDLDGMVMSGEEAIKVIEKYRTQINDVKLHNDTGNPYADIDNVPIDQALNRIDKNETYTCFVVTEYYTGGKSLQFIEQYRAPLLYDGAILTGQEVIDIINKVGQNRKECRWFTERCPEGYSYYYYWDTIEEKARINPTWEFKASMDRNNSGTNMVTSLNFYQTTVDTIESVGTVCEGDVINGETLISLIDTYASEETPIYFFYKYNFCVYNIKGNQTDNDSRGVYSDGKYYCMRYNADHLVFVYDQSLGEWGYCHSLPWYDSY